MLARHRGIVAALVEGGQSLRDLGVVHRAAVVRIHERRSPLLGALVDVRHAGHGELDQLLRQRVRPARCLDSTHDALHRAAHGRVLQHQVDQPAEICLEGLVAVDPCGRGPGLAGGLQGVVHGALAADGPGPHHGLKHQVHQRAIGQRTDAPGLGIALHGGERHGPLLPDLGEHADPRAHRLRALGVVGGQGRHGQRLVAVTTRELVVGLLSGQRERRRIPAHLGERGETGVAVERTVLHALGHDHAGGLLEAPCRRSQLRLVLDPQPQDRAQSGEHLGQLRTGALRGLQGLGQVLRAPRQVGAVDAEAAEDLAQGVHQGLVRDALQGGLDGGLAGQALDLGMQGPVRHGPLGPVDHPLPVALLSLLGARAGAQGGVQSGQRVLPVRVHEQPVDHTQGVVARGAGRQALLQPFARQQLPGLQDLLDQGVAPAGELGQPAEVLRGIAHPVRVIDAQPVHQALVDPATDLHVRVLEDLAVLDPDPRQGGDREEAAVVQGSIPAAPVDQLVVLPLMDHPGRLRGPAVVIERRRALGHRVDVVEVGQHRLPVAQLDLELLQRLVGPTRARSAVLVGVVAEHRDHHPVAEGLPVDVEGLRVLGAASVAQQRPPPRVLRRGGHALVVRHDVHQHAQVQLVRRAAEAVEGVPAPAGRVDLGGIGHVVAVVRAAHGAQDRREVDPVRAERLQALELLGCCGEVEVGGDLESVGRGGNTHVVSSCAGAGAPLLLRVLGGRAGPDRSGPAPVSGEPGSPGSRLTRPAGPGTRRRRRRPPPRCPARPRAHPTGAAPPWTWP